MESIGFVGVGSIGSPMARCLAKAGYKLTICDKNVEAREKFTENAVRITDKPSDCAGSEMIIVMVASDSQVKEVILGSNGVLSGVNPDRPPLLAIMSTILPQTTKEVALQCEKKGVRVVDATVTGGPLVAEQGKITIMVGGGNADFEVMRPIFEVMGEHIYHTGALGSGDVTKLVNNIIGATNIFLTLEAMLLGKKCGMDPDRLASILKTGSGLNFLTYDWEKGRAFMDFFFKNQDSAKLACDFGRKDLGHALELALEAGVACPLLDKVVEAVKRFSPEELLEKWHSTK
jgi:3-hydroxyisobutyrate dehydrogenase